MEEIVELTILGANTYGGSDDTYEEQKKIERAAHEQQLHDAKNKNYYPSITRKT